MIAITLLKTVAIITAGCWITVELVAFFLQCYDEACAAGAVRRRDIVPRDIVPR